MKSKIKRVVKVQPGDEYAECTMFIPWRDLVDFKHIYHQMMDPNITHKDCLILMADMVDMIDRDIKPQKERSLEME